MITRRTTLKSLALGAAAFSSGIGLALPVRAQEPDKFPNPLKIPELLEGTVIDGIRHFDLRLQEGISQFLPGQSTPTWGINGDYLGPTLRMRDAETVRLNVTNNLQEATNMHWHGFLVPAICDGGPAQIINPGMTWRPEFKLYQPATTNWYHSHMMHNTGPQVYKGLAGMIIVDDEHSGSIELPADYGVDDIPVMVQDRNFNSDGGLLEAPLQRTSMVMAPAERADIVVDVSDGRDALLVSHGMMSMYPEYPGAMSQFLREMDSENFEILAIRPQSALAPSSIIPAAFTPIARLDPTAAVNTRRLNLNMGHGHRSGEDRGPHTGLRSGYGGGYGGGNYSINGRRMTMDFVNERVPLGAVEIWELYNNSPMTHPIHVHNVHFQILDRNGTPPPPEERGLKDTVRVNPQELVRLLVKFEHYTDPQTPYMYHCHMLEHEDRGMMGQFVVV